MDSLMTLHLLVNFKIDLNCKGHPLLSSPSVGETPPFLTDEVSVENRSRGNAVFDLLSKQMPCAGTIHSNTVK